MAFLNSICLHVLCAPDLTISRLISGLWILFNVSSNLPFNPFMHFFLIGGMYLHKDFYLALLHQHNSCKSIPNPILCSHIFSQSIVDVLSVYLKLRITNLLKSLFKLRNCASSDSFLFSMGMSCRFTHSDFRLKIW